MIIYLYKKTHLVTGLKYLGITKRKDPVKYKGSGKYWQNHIKKHGYFCDTEILKECHTWEEVRHWGKYYSDLYDIVKSSDWANLIDEVGDGASFTQHTDTTKSVLKEIARNRPADYYENIHNNHKGIPLTEDHKTKISQSLKGRETTTQHRANLSRALKGKTFTERFGEERAAEIISTRSAKIRGRKDSPETRAKKSQAKAGKTYEEIYGSPEKAQQRRDNRVKNNKYPTTRKTYSTTTITQCPHCGKIGSSRNMTRYHFDKCTRV